MDSILNWFNYEESTWKIQFLNLDEYIESYNKKGWVEENIIAKLAISEFLGEPKRFHERVNNRNSTVNTTGSDRRMSPSDSEEMILKRSLSNKVEQFNLTFGTSLSI